VNIGGSVVQVAAARCRPTTRSSTRTRDRHDAPSGLSSGPPSGPFSSQIIYFSNISALSTNASIRSIWSEAMRSKILASDKVPSLKYCAVTATLTKGEAADICRTLPMEDLAIERLKHVLGRDAGALEPRAVDPASSSPPKFEDDVLSRVEVIWR